MSESDRRAAENESRFRDANERISRTAERLQMQELLPFICECERPGCTTILRLGLSAYEDVRASPRRFLCAPGHEPASAQSRIVQRTDGFEVVEKLAESAQVAEELDPRGE
jgi:hypothetical protein